MNAVATASSGIARILLRSCGGRRRDGGPLPVDERLHLRGPGNVALRAREPEGLARIPDRSVAISEHRHHLSRVDVPVRADVQHLEAGERLHQLLYEPPR